VVLGVLERLRNTLLQWSDSGIRLYDALSSHVNTLEHKIITSYFYFSHRYYSRSYDILDFSSSAGVTIQVKFFGSWHSTPSYALPHELGFSFLHYNNDPPFCSLLNEACFDGICVSSPSQTSWCHYGWGCGEGERIQCLQHDCCRWRVSLASSFLMAMVFFL